MDGHALPEGLPRVLVHPLSRQRDPLAMGRVLTPFATGVSALDGFLTCGVGQRLGIFAGSGVGKSTLLGMLARRCEADAVVIGLIGERGREVRDFLERDLGDEGRARSVVIVATSDQPPALRVQAALTATSVAEALRSEGLKVLLLMDSVTRFAQSLREIGLSLGEPPATRGYPPSVFAALPRLLERSGAVEGGGSITAFYTVLVEGDDMNEPVADTVRGILDGHVVLARSIAEGGRYPAVDVLASLSRCMPEVVTPEHLALAQRGRRLFSALEGIKDLLSVGAYREGADPMADEARKLVPVLEDMIRQVPADVRTFSGSVANLKLLLGAGAP
jgi:FliI/YscN family ATPase